MTQEDKELLLKDLCARLPYIPIIKIEEHDWNNLHVDAYDTPFKSYYLEPFIIGEIEIKPYLRPMSSMTEEEKAKLKFLTTQDLSEFAEHITNGHGLSHDGLYMFDKLRQLDFCLSHHLDFRGLIPMGLALEASEEMYK